MQYETIILEMLSRIKKLENDVNALKQAQSIFPSSSLQENNESEEMNLSVHGDSPVEYKKMTDEMIDICYQYGKRVHSGESAPEMAEEIVSKTGMNHNSAIMYLYAVRAMMEGTVYKRAISAKAMQRYFDKIFNEYGSKGLRAAIQATRLHINYRRKLGHTVDSIEEICKRYENTL